MSQSPLQWEPDANPNQKPQLAAYLSAGKAMRQLLYQGQSFSGHERNCVYLHTGRAADLRFANVSAVSGLDFEDDARSVATVDWDFDGDLDLWIANRTAPNLRFMRNNTPRGESHFLSVRLIGRSCNRDAIGARLDLVMADAGDRRLIRSLRAGEGFQSQSSKWIHFGLGPSTEIERLSIRWPGGAQQDFEQLEVDRHYVLEQGRPDARLWQVPTREAQRLQHSPLAPARDTEQARVFLGAAPPLPVLTFRDFDGRPRPIGPPLNRPLLLNLWASWCMPCQTELEALKQHAPELTHSGIDVLALSVDGLGSNSSSSPGSPGSIADAQILLNRLQLPFAVGMADERLLAVLQVYHNVVFLQQRPLPVPTSILINRSGVPHVVYKGPIDVSELLVDVSRLEIDATRKRDLAIPFPGRWRIPILQVRPSRVSKALHNAGLVEEARAYAQRFRRSADGQVTAY